MYIKLTFSIWAIYAQNKKQKYSAYLPKTIRCTLPSLSHEFLLNKLLSVQTFLKTTRFPISVRGPILWNNCLSKNEKEIDNFLLFQQRAKEKIKRLGTAANLFQ